MTEKHDSVVERLAAQAIAAGANMLDIEYKDGYEEVFAMQGSSDYGHGYGVAKLKSSSPEAVSLRKELYAILRRRLRIQVNGCTYSLRCHKYDSFGEDAFRIELQRL